MDAACSIVSPIMKFYVENVPVYFPYPYVYEEQYAYMRHLKRAMDRKGQHIPLTVHLYACNLCHQEANACSRCRQALARP